MSYTAGPARYDHDLIIGDTYTVQASLEDEDGTPYDITSATGVAAIVTQLGGAVLATPTVTITDGAAGEFKWVVAAATTAALEQGTGILAVRLTFADTTVATVVEGTVKIRPSAVS